ATVYGSYRRASRGSRRMFKGVGVELPWRPVSVLFGPNDAGKTNLLEAIEFGTKCIFGASIAKDDPVINARHSNAEVARRWPYAVPIRLRKSACVPQLDLAPLLASVAPEPQDKVGQEVSHFGIGYPEFTRALRLRERARLDATKRGLQGP